VRPDDFNEFSKALEALAGIYGRTMSAPQVAMYFKALGAQSLPEVQRAMQSHLQDGTPAGRLMPTPSDLIGRVEGPKADDGRPGPEEAWAIALAASDESRTVVWTGEMAYAWGICWEVFKAGDQVGARMAFKEAYARIVAEARKQRVRASWNVSEGWDAEQRTKAIEHAVALGQLPSPKHPLLPAPRSRATLGELASKAPPEIAQKLHELREEFARRARGADLPATPDGVAKEHTAQRKAQIAQQVQRYEGQA